MQQGQSSTPREQDSQQTTQTGQRDTNSAEPRQQEIPKQEDKAEGEDNMDFAPGSDGGSAGDGGAA